MPTMKESELQSLALTRALEDLKAQRQATQLPPPPPTSHTPNPNNRCTLSTLATFLPAKERRSLLAQITPLADTELPEPSDLPPFWLRVEGAIESIDNSIDLGALTSAHLT